VCCRYNPKKVKWSRYRSGVAQRVGRCTALLLHDRGTRRGEWSAARPGPALPPVKTRYPFYRRLGGPQGRSGRAENLVPTGIQSRTVQPVRSLQIQSYFWKPLSNCFVKQLIAFYAPQYLPSVCSELFFPFPFLYVRVQWAGWEGRGRLQLEDYIGSRFTEQLLVWTLRTKFIKILLR